MINIVTIINTINIINIIAISTILNLIIMNNIDDYIRTIINNHINYLYIYLIKVKPMKMKRVSL